MTPRVAILSESLTARMDLTEGFTAAGFFAEPCDSIARTLQLFEQQKLDVVIVDGHFSNEALAKLRAQTNALHPGALLLTSAGSETAPQSGGAVHSISKEAYAEKPYDLERLIRHVRSLLRLRSAATARPILLVEDSKTFRETLAAALEALGHTVLRAESGEEGLRLAASHRPWAFIVDGILPGMDGRTFIGRIRLDGAFRGAPCILLTAAQEREAELRALESGADTFVRKDEDLELLLAKLTVALRPSAELRSDSQTRSLLEPKKILAIDDSPTYRHELSRALIDEGYNVSEASSGLEALRLLGEQRVDCILLDLVMPEMDGKETCRRLKATEALRDIPVLVLTSVESRETMLEGLAVGADDYIQKSSDFEVLKARVRAQLRRRQFEEQARQAREQILRREIDEAEANAALELAETRAILVRALEEKNAELRAAYAELQGAQSQLVQAAKMASLGELVAGVAHEINNPLAFALSHLGTALSSLAQCDVGESITQSPARPHWDKAQNRLSEMKRGLERIRELVVKLRTFSRLDEGERKHASVSECVESTLMILGHRLHKGLRVVKNYGEPDEIDCYPGLVNQALMNLLSNAIDAVGPNGTIEIETGARGDHYILAISDDGVGIPEHLRDRVLEPFFTTKDVGKGTGLGLSITYSIAQKHGGELSLLPRAGTGTLALIRIPLQRQT